LSNNDHQTASRNGRNAAVFYKLKNGSLTGTNGLAILLNYTFTRKDLGKLG